MSIGTLFRKVKNISKNAPTTYKGNTVHLGSQRPFFASVIPGGKQEQLKKLWKYKSQRISLENLEVIHLVDTQIFRKTRNSYPLIRISTCAYQGLRIVSFLNNFAYLLSEWSIVNISSKIDQNICLNEYLP